ncbi:acyltransferase family protein [Xanthobacter sp. AM11]|uniref:acyltransferase family protein n=1 Tax=Xanthobacter sp. AM11 TaxID=3380643 RepID=UPI0039BFB58B
MLESLQYLRAIASLAVVFVHLQPPLERLGLTARWLQTGAFGVDIFFVLSGFLIFITTYNKGGDFLGSFYRKRWLRIVPLYWMITTFVLLLLLGLPQLVKSGEPDIWHIVASYLFLPAAHPTLGSLEPLFVPGWTMNYEVFYFLLWGLVLFLPRRTRAPVYGGIMLTLVVIGLLAQSKQPFVAFYTSPIMLEFVFGVVLGVWYREAPPAPRWCGWALLCIGFFALFFPPEYTNHGQRLIQRGIPAFMVLAGAVVLERTRPVPRFGVFALLGDASYSTYLTHSIILSAVGQVFVKLAMPATVTTGVLYGVAGVAASIAGSIIFHKLVEKRVLQMMRDTPVPAPKPVAQSGK